MSVNSSSNSSPELQSDGCFLPETAAIILSLLAASSLMVPLFIFVLVLGYQKWRKQRSGSPLSASSHIDIFTYNIVFLELFSVLGTCFNLSYISTSQTGLGVAGTCLYGIYLPGQVLFHLATCVERYLAVVHPIIYLRLRGEVGIRIRNALIGCIWLTSFGLAMLVKESVVAFETMDAVMLSFPLVVFFFCSFSVLCVLIRPGPGEGGGDRERDQTKRRAFHTMVIITGALSLRFLTNLTFSAVQTVLERFSFYYCVIGWASVWFFVPSSLVSPLLFLQREGKLPGCGPKPDETT